MDDLNKILTSEEPNDPVQNNTDKVQIGSNLQAPDQILQTTSNIQGAPLDSFEEDEGIPLSSFLENRLYEEDDMMQKPALASIPMNLAKNNKRYGAFEDYDEEDQ